MRPSDPIDFMSVPNPGGDMPKIVEDDGFVIRWGPYTKKELDEIWAEGVNGAPISSPSLSLSTKEMRSKKGPNSTPASSPSLPSSKKLLCP
jgi:hypothetical protein